MVEDLEEIEEEFEGRMTDSAIPDQWNPEEEGESIIAQLVDIRLEPEAWVAQDEEPDNLFIVKTIDSDSEIRLPSHNILQSLMEAENPKIGDLLKVQFEGKGDKTSKGRAPFQYQLGVLPKEEAIEKLGEDKLVNVEGRHVRKEKESEVQKKQATTTGTKATEGESEVPSKAPGEVQEDEDEEEGDNLAEYVNELMDFYEDGMDVDEFDEYLNEARDFDIEPEKAAKLCGLEIKDDKVRSA